MKKLILILTTAIVVSSCGHNDKYTYLVKDIRGNRFYCNFYNETGNGCIMFNNEPGDNNTPGKPTVVCGSYTIQKLK